MTRDEYSPVFDVAHNAPLRISDEAWWYGIMKMGAGLR